MLEKMILSEEEYECLAKGIALGVGIGTFVGIFIGNVILAFSAGGVIGILVSFIYSYYKRIKKTGK